MRLCARPAILQAFPAAACCREERESRSASPAAKALAGTKAQQIQPQPPPGQPLRSRMPGSASVRLRARAAPGCPPVRISLRRCHAAAVWGPLLNIGEETCVLAWGLGQDPAPWSVLAPKYRLPHLL